MTFAAKGSHPGKDGAPHELSADFQRNILKAAPAQAKKRVCQILNFRAYEKNSLQGFFDLQLPSGMILRGCTLHAKGESRWIGFPAKPFTKPDGTQSWLNIVDFVDNKTKYLLQDMALPPVLAALAEANEGEP